MSDLHVPPTGDLKLEAFATNADEKITATPTAFGLVAAQATEYHGLCVDFSARLATAINPATRTKGTIAAKNTAKAALLAKTRELLRIISAHPGLTDQQRADLGMKVRDHIPTPQPTPATRPVITVDTAGHLRLVDETAPTRRARPAYVMGAFLFMKVAASPTEPPPSKPSEAEFAGLTTRTNHTLSLPEGSVGKTLHVLAQWVNARGEPGPVSLVASTLIAA